MFANEQLHQWKEQLRKPQIILAAVALIGFLIVVISSTYAFIPALRQELNSAKELWFLKQTIGNIEKNPITEPYDPETATPWLRKVPVREDHSAVIRTLLDLERSSGADILRISFEEKAKGEESDELAQLMQSMNKSAKAKPAAQSEQQEQPVINEQGFYVEPLQVEALGSYADIHRFWDGLHKLERLAMVREWSIEATADSQVKFHATLSIFTAPDFSKVLPEPESVKPDLSARRSDPTMPEGKFIEKLQPVQ